MTREELKEHCEKQIEMCEFWAIGKGEKPSGKVYEEHKLILELLKQEPCEDCISRQFMYELGATCIATRDKNNKLIALGAIENLPPVTPQQKTGHWISFKMQGEVDGQIVYDWGKCPNCGWEFEDGDKDWEEPYCCHCGQKLKWFER